MPLMYLLGRRLGTLNHDIALRFRKLQFRHGLLLARRLSGDVVAGSFNKIAYLLF
jgi:hypothetical protein